MAITAAQRQVGLDAIMQAYPNQELIAKLLPNVTAAQVLTFIANAVGANADTQLTTVLSNKVAAATADSANHQAIVNADQANITAWTVV